MKSRAGSDANGLHDRHGLNHCDAERSHPVCRKVHYVTRHRRGGLRQKHRDPIVFKLLEFDDIQYILLTRVPALTGRYEFLSFQQPAQGRAWLEAIREKVPSAKAVADTVNLEKRWVSVAFTWNGLRTLGVDEASLATFPEEFRQGMAARWQVLGDTGVDEASLATFPEEFRQGMAARWQVLGDTGTNHPDNWIGGLGGPQLHAIAILFARDAAERERSVREHKALLARTPGVEVLSSLDLEAIPF